MSMPLPAAVPPVPGPTADAADRRRHNLQGMAWMVAAMAAFAVEDALVKAVARQLPVGQLLLLFGLGGMAVFAAVAAWPGRRGVPLRHPAVWSKTMRVRAVFELVGRLFYVLAVALTPLSSATAILQATPVLVVLGASLWFGERVGWRRWAAIAAGLAGVLLVLRPAGDDFSWGSVLAVVGVLGFAGRDLASRAVPPVLGTPHLGFYGFATVGVAGVLYGLWRQQAWVWPAGPTALGLVAAIAVGAAAYACLMKAMRTGDVAVVTPLRYTRLLFGVALGVGVFGERVDGPMLLGGAVIVAAGLLIAWDSRR